MKRILFYHVTEIIPQKGGVENVTYFWCNYFTQKGFEVHVIFWKKHLNCISEIKQTQLPDQTDYYSKDNVLFIQNYLKSKKIDVVINQNGINNRTSLTPLLASIAEDIPVISVLHNSPDHYLKKNKYSNRWMYNRVSKVLLKKLYCVIQNLPFYKGGRYIFDHSSRIVVLSEQYIKEYIDCNLLGAYNKDKILSIANPLTMAKIKDATSADRKAVLAIGRLSEQKSLDKLLYIWRLIELRNTDWTLYIVGDGEEREMLESLANRLSLKHVCFVGNVNPVEYYKKSSVLCMTSIYEGLPMVLIESRAFGLVPIVYNSFAASKDLINNSVDGYIVDAFNEQLYVEKLLLLMESAALRNEMSAQSFLRMDDFNPNFLGNKWIELINQI